MQIVETALESNRDNPRLLAMQGTHPAGARATRAARAPRSSARSPRDRERRHRPRGARRSLSQQRQRRRRAGDARRRSSRRRSARGERGTRGRDAQPHPARRRRPHADARAPRRASTRGSTRRRTSSPSMSSLAEAHVAKGQFENAAEVLEKLIQREPQNAQHRNEAAVRPLADGRRRHDAGAADAARGSRRAAVDGDRRAGAVVRFVRRRAGALLRSRCLGAARPRSRHRLRTAASASSLRRHRRSARTPTLSRLQSAVELAAADLDADDARRRSRLHHRAPHRGRGLREVRPGRKSDRAPARHHRARAETSRRAREAVSASCSTKATSKARAPPPSSTSAILQEKGDTAARRQHSATSS